MKQIFQMLIYKIGSNIIGYYEESIAGNIMSTSTVDIKNRYHVTVTGNGSLRQ